MLSAARVPAERYPAMSWVTKSWGTAPVIFAGQGKKDHLRAAIQMLSDTLVPGASSTAILAGAGWAIAGPSCTAAAQSVPMGCLVASRSIPAATVSAPTSCLHHQGPVSLSMPCAPRSRCWSSDRRPSRAPLLGAVYRAPLGGADPVDFSIHITGPTGSAQVGAGHPWPRPILAPASIAGVARVVGESTPELLEKKAFLAKDTVLVVDDFAPDRDDRRRPAAAPRCGSSGPCRRQSVWPRADARRRWQPADLLPARSDRFHWRGHPLGPEPSCPPPGSWSWHPATSTPPSSRAFNGMLATGFSQRRWPAMCSGSRRASMICGVTLPERQRALRDDFVRQGGAQAHAGNRCQHRDRLGDVPQLRRGGRSPLPRRKRSRCWSVRAPQFSVRQLLRPDIGRRARSRPPVPSPCSALRSTAVVLMSRAPATMARRTMPIAGAGIW